MNTEEMFEKILSKIDNLCERVEFLEFKLNKLVSKDKEKILKSDTNDIKSKIEKMRADILRDLDTDSKVGPGI